MSDDAAYELTKAFWESKAAMAETSPWWKGVDQSLMGNVAVKFHPGAIRYYKEAGMELTADQM